MYAKKNSGKKVMLLLLAIVLLIGCAAGGTLAWLAAKTDPIPNTFTVANINITLTETFNKDGDSDGIDDLWEGKLVPGTKIAKDPKVTVLANSETCWLFVKVNEAGGSGTIGNVPYTFADYVGYTVRTGEGGWTALGESYPGVYYREVSSSTNDQEFYVLTGGTETGFENGFVTIPDTLTKAKLDVLGTGENKIAIPSLTFTAYAVQKEGFTEEDAGKSGVERAWEQARALENAGTGN